MRKITFLLLSLILLSGLTHAQVAPEPSSDDNGPWYYIQVKGSNDVRFDRVMSANLDATLGVERVYGIYKNDATTDEALNRMLWRIEDNGDDTYIIVNKFTQKQMSIWNWAAQSKDMLTVDDDPVTNWTITETDANPGYYFIRATTPLATTGFFCTHQGNSTWNYGIIMEADSWGAGEDSQFCFLDYEDLTVGLEDANFGYSYENPDDEQVVDPILLNIIGTRSLTENITYELADNTHFTYTIENWDDKTGGVLALWFLPREVGEWTTTLTVRSKTAEGDLEKVVTLRGVARPNVPVKISPTVENSDSDVWYSIQFNQRTGYYMKDVGAEEKLEVYPGLNENEPSQLWKFVAIANNDTAYKIVSKLGNQLKYFVEEVQVNPDSIAKIGRFYATATSDNTFSFRLRNKDGDWMLQWNEYQKEVEDEVTGDTILEDAITFINKTNNDKGFTQYYSLTDVGNSVKFYEFGKGTFVKTNLPEFSNDDKEVWYFIQFERVIGKGLTTHAVKSPGEIEVGITQSEVLDPEDITFHWKFVGTFDDCTIVDAAGYEFGVTGNAQTSLVASGEGAHYSFVRFSTTNNWQLECLSDVTDTYRFINDFTGGSTQVGGYSSGDGGAEIVLVPLDMWGVDTGMENITEDMDQDPVINTVYYTLQGVQLNVIPSQEGIYIVKKIHASKKISAEKVYIPRK